MALVRLLRRSQELSSFNTDYLKSTSQNLEKHVIKSLLAVPFIEIDVSDAIRDKFEEYDKVGFVEIFTQRSSYRVVPQFH